MLSRAAAKLNAKKPIRTLKRKATGGAGDEPEPEPGQDTGGGEAGGPGTVSRTTTTGLIMDLDKADEVRQPIITLCCKSIASLDSKTKIVASRFPYKLEPDVYNLRGFICANGNIMNNKSFGSF